jgi:hypothetical protein
VESFLTFIIRPDDPSLTGTYSLSHTAHLNALSVKLLSVQRFSIHLTVLEQGYILLHCYSTLLYSTLLYSTIHLSSSLPVTRLLAGRPGPGLTTAGVSQISDSESDNDDKNDRNDKNLNCGDDGDDVSVEKEKKQKKGEKKRGEKRKGGELGERDQGSDGHSSNSSTNDASKSLKDGKKKKSKGGSSSEAVVYDIRSDDDNDDGTDVVQVYPTQPSLLSNRSSSKKTSVEDLFYPTKESDPWDADTPGSGAPKNRTQKDVSTSTKRKNIDEDFSLKKKKTAHVPKNVPENVPRNVPQIVPSSSDTDSSEDDYEGVVLRR